MASKDFVWYTMEINMASMNLEHMITICMASLDFVWHRMAMSMVSVEFLGVQNDHHYGLYGLCSVHTCH